MNKLDMLWDIEQIKQLKARYFRCVDSKNYSGFEDVFTDDVEWSHQNENKQIDLIYHGKAAVREWLEGLGSSLVSVHNGYMPEIEICDEATAKGIWGMEDYVTLPGHDNLNLRGYGHYHEKYVKDENGEWKISELLITRIRIDRTKSD